MTPEELKTRHGAMHRALDELAACFLAETDCKELPTDTTLARFMEWSWSMTHKPTCVRQHPDQPEHGEERLASHVAGCLEAVNAATIWSVTPAHGTRLAHIKKKLTELHEILEPPLAEKG